MNKKIIYSTVGSKRLGPQATIPLFSLLPGGNITHSTADDNTAENQTLV